MDSELHYFADYSLHISLVLLVSLFLYLHMSMSVILMVENWIEILGFPNKKFAIRVFYSFFEALNRSLLVLAFVESVCVHEGFLLIFIS